MRNRETSFSIFQFLICVLFFLFCITLTSAKTSFSFPHKKHLEAEIECVNCHTGILKSTKAADNNLPQVKVCSECHEPFKELKEFTTGKRIVKFSHKEHLNRKIKCAVCHTLKKDTLEVVLPEMKTCSECHNGKEAPEDCDICHINLLSGKLKPKSHNIFWVRSHRVQATEEQGYCDNCHKQSFCQECHIGDNVKPLSHRRNFLYTHPLEQRKREKDCRACHEIETFCADCHREQMVLPISHNSVDWSNIADGGRHRIEAKRDIEYCAICHNREESICLDCHK